MSIGLIAWGRFYKTDSSGNIQRVTVPAPSTDPGKPWLWDFLRSEANALSNSFDFVQLPSASLTQSGTADTGDGYGITWRRMMDNTRYGGPDGTEKLMAMCAALRAAGVKVFGDLVLHQFAEMTKAYPGRAKGAQTEGWFRGHCSWNAKTQTWNDPIPPYCAQDDVPSPSSDFAFGAEISYQHCTPAGVTEADAVDFLSWMEARFAIYDWRMDDVKGQHAPSMCRIMNSVSGSFYSEFFDNAQNSGNWATSSPMNSRSAVEDFDLHFRLQAACDGFNASLFDRGGAGYWQDNSGLAVGFTDNPDTDTSPGQQVVFNKGLAYALMLNLPLRNALVYGKDYFPASVWPGAYGLKPIIDNLCWIARMFAFGAFERRWVDQDVYAYTRDGNGGPVGWSGGLLVAVNFNTLNPRTITCATMWPANTHLHDYRGNHGDIWTDHWGNATFTLQSNAFSAGLSSCCFAPAGVDKPVWMTPMTTTQTYLCAAGEDVKAIVNGMQDLPQRLRIAADSRIVLTLDFSRVGIDPSASVNVSLRDSTGAVHATGSSGSGNVVILHTTAPSVVDWYTIRLIGTNLPTTGASAAVTVTYTGTNL